jgi:hypothetical protein
MPSNKVGTGKLEVVRKHLPCTNGVSYTDQSSGAIPRGESRFAYPWLSDYESLPPVEKAREWEREKGKTETIARILGFSPTPAGSSGR